MYTQHLVTQIWNIQKKKFRTFSSFDPLSHMTYKKSIEILKL